MAICKFCGEKVIDGTNFCLKCGRPLNDAASSGRVNAAANYKLHKHIGQAQRFEFLGIPINIPSEVDTFNYYRKEFKALAKDASNKLRYHYNSVVRDIDSFLIKFDNIYAEERMPIIKTAVSILSEYDIYDVTLDSFSNRHTENFCLIREDITNMANAFEATVEANQDRRAKLFGLLPGVIFRGGIGAFVAAGLFNAGMDAVSESAIRNAKVKPAQKVELFNRIKTDNIINRSYLDYWRVFLTMSDIIREHGIPMWTASDDLAARTNNIASNMISGNIPPERIPNVFASLLEAFPYNSAVFVFMNKKYSGNSDLQMINNYFGFDGIEV